MTRQELLQPAQANRRTWEYRTLTLQRIWIDPERCFGKPCIRGHRIWVSLILDFLASGRSQQGILQDYPQFEPLDIQACIAYAAEIADERYVEIPLEPAHEGQTR